MLQRALLTLLLLCTSMTAQPPAAAAKGQVTQVRQVGLVTLVQVVCPENRLTMELWLAPRIKAPWLIKGLKVNIVPTGEGQDVRYSPGRTPRPERAPPLRQARGTRNGARDAR